MTDARENPDHKDDEGSTAIGWGLLLLAIVAPIAWLAFNEDRLARVAAFIGVICMIAGVVQKAGTKKEPPASKEAEGSESD